MASVPRVKKNAIELLADNIINHIDTYRGDMSRLDLLRIIIRQQLLRNDDEEDFYRFIKDVIEILSDYLELSFEERVSKAEAISH